MTDANVPVPAAPAPWQQRMAADQFDVTSTSGAPWRRLRVGGAILKAQGAICRDLYEGRSLGTYAMNFALLIVLASLAYGAILGSFAGWEQAGYAALKFPMVVVGAALLCLPSFYVFQCLAGSSLTLAQATAAIFYFAAAAGLLLLAFAPIAWFFTISTEREAWRFIAAFHFSVAAIAAAFGVAALSKAQRYLEWLHAGETVFSRPVLNSWFLLYLLIAVQMAYYLKPLMSPGPFFTGERGLFLEGLRIFLGGR